MAVSPATLSGPRKEMSILESNQYLLSQLEESKQKLQDLREKYLTSKATAFSLANHLQKYECEEYKELIKSVLEEELQSEEGGVAEELRRGARLGKSDSLFQAQAQELTYLRQKIQEGRGVCYLFAQHVKNAVRSFESVLRSTGVTSYHGQRLCEQLTQGSKLAENLARRLTTENHNKKDEDRQRLLALRFSREVPEEEANEILEDSLDERYLTPSSHCDCQQSSSSNVILSNLQEATSALGIARHSSSLHRPTPGPIALPGSEGSGLGEEYKGLPASLNSISRPKGSSSQASRPVLGTRDRPETSLRSPLTPAGPHPSREALCGRQV
uniref:NBPF family member NBPF6-like protein n=1 Tax=Callospermophilus lateralis TaxID=76772 RepID=UPI0040388B5F